MPKQLLIMRHAKSSWSEANLADHDRPLNRRGLRDAPRMGLRLSEYKLIPDAVVASTAVRARTTAELVIENCRGIRTELELDPDFYHAPPSTYTTRMRRLDNGVERVLFVGHNPGMGGIGIRPEWRLGTNAHRRPGDL